MYALFIIINDLSFLDAVLEKLVELKVRGATIVDSKGMAQAIMDNERLSFLGSGNFFERFLDQDQKTSKTIFSVIPESDKMPTIIEGIKSVVSKSTKQVIGFMFTVPVAHIIPLKPEKLIK